MPVGISFADRLLHLLWSAYQIPAVQELGLVYTKMDRECAHDTALMTLLAVIRSKAEKKMQQGGIDPIEIRARAL